jgi:hypothetical protein
VIFENVSPIHIPVFLLNKSISMAAVFFLFLTALQYVRNDIEKTKFWGTASLHCAYLHILLSLAILSSTYYPKFFGVEKMNLIGEISIFFGVLAVYCFWTIRGASSFIQRQTFQILSSLFIVGHLVAMGFSGWLTIEKWHGGLPPISLISVVFALISFVLFFWNTSKRPT